ncbi:hypothetical protein AB0I81_52840 [Nonomuraea sp. NPDC050404]|uniref:dTMP kinase n=1 Tax=Nonomuraea sp. NPDC050404 TaxID=3155783 RepID=UPI0033F20235
MSRFVVLLGPDGAGKSTLLRELAALRAGLVTTALDPLAVYGLPGLAETVPWAGRTHPREVIWDLPAHTRTTLLAHVLAVSHDLYLAPALRAGGLVVCDSYDYRYRAKERVLDPATSVLLESLAATLPRPELAVWIDVPMEVAWRRNGGRCSRFEGGPRADYPGFERLQEQVKEIILSELLDGCPIVRLDGLREPAELARDCLAAIDPVPTAKGGGH